MPIVLTCALVVSPAYALPPGKDDVFVRVADTGAGLCWIVKMPGNKYLVYDAGHRAGSGSPAAEKIQDLIEPGKTIELPVVSHSDADHIRAAKKTCHTYTVKKAIRSGKQPSPARWHEANTAIRDGKRDENCTDIPRAPGRPGQQQSGPREFQAGAGDVRVVDTVKRPRAPGGRKESGRRATRRLTPEVVQASSAKLQRPPPPRVDRRKGSQVTT